MGGRRVSGVTVVEGAGDGNEGQEQAEHAAAVSQGAAEVHAERAEAAAAAAAELADSVGAAASAAVSAADDSQMAAAQASDSAQLVEVSGREILDAISAQTNVLNSALEEFRASRQSAASTQPAADQGAKKKRTRESAPATGKKSVRERYFGS